MGMIVVYATFEFDSEDRVGFQEWFQPLATQVPRRDRVRDVRLGL